MRGEKAWSPWEDKFSKVLAMSVLHIFPVNALKDNICFQTGLCWPLIAHFPSSSSVTVTVSQEDQVGGHLPQAALLDFLWGKETPSLLNSHNVLVLSHFPFIQQLRPRSLLLLSGTLSRLRSGTPWLPESYVLPGTKLHIHSTCVSRESWAQATTGLLWGCLVHFEILFCFIFLATLHCMWNLSSPTKDWTCAALKWGLNHWTGKFFFWDFITSSPIIVILSLYRPALILCCGQAQENFQKRIMTFDFICACKLDVSGWRFQVAL